MAEKLHWLRRPLWQAAFIVSGLLVWSFYMALSWISALPPLAQALLGAALGLTSMASYSNSQTQRSQHRKRTIVSLAQLSLADMLALQRLLPDNEKALSWLPGPSDEELVRWINIGLEKAWPFFKEASSGLIKVKLETVYNKYKAGAIKGISIGKINLGKFGPFIQGVKAFPSNEGDRCCLEIQVDWRQNEDQDMLLHVTTTGPEFVVQVKDFVVYCVLRLTFTPLSQELPCFAAVVFSIIEPPLVDFQTKFISGDVKKMPGMEKAVDNILLAAVMDLLVWPGRVVVPVLPGDYSDLEASCVGHLHVQLVEARDLANKEITGKCDPYMVLFVRRRTDLIKQSTQMQDTCDPVWNEQFMFNVEDLEVQRLTIKLMNMDEGNIDVFVGTAEIAIGQLKENVLEDLWIDLVGDPARLHGRIAGRVHLLVEFNSKNDTGDMNDAGSGAFGGSTLQPDEILSSSSEGIDQLEIGHASKDRAPSSGLRVILETNGRVSADDNFRLVAPNYAIASLNNSPNVEIQGPPSLIADMKAQAWELAGNNEEKALNGVEGISQSASEEAVAVAEPLESLVSERQGCLLLVVKGEGSQKGIHQYHEETCSTVSAETDSSTSTVKDGKAEIVAHGRLGKEAVNERGVDMGKDSVTQPSVGLAMETVNEPNLVVVGDPAWGLNGLSLEHCNTWAIRQDMFSSEIFEID